MESQKLTDLDIATLAGLISRKEVSPVEVVQATLARIDLLNPRLNAYISVYPELALESARKAEREIQSGGYRGPLHGVPLAVKDLYQVAGMRRTCGSRLIDEAPAATDATAVARLKRSGAVILGLLTLHEFAFGPTGINPHFGTAHNPWDPERVCGGSSSGAGCAVAAGLAAGALGSDTGGSIRIPAALCGVVGLKQTYGLASRQGIYPLVEDFDHGGPLTRTAEDAALLLQAIAGEDPADPSTRGNLADRVEERLDRGMTDCRIGVPDAFFFQGLHPSVQTAVETAIGVLGDLGAVVIPVSLPFAEEAVNAWNTIAMCEAYTLHEAHIREQGDLLSPDVKARLLRGATITGEELVRARWVQKRVQVEMAGILDGVDILVTPTAPIPAVAIDTGTIEVDGEEVDGVAVLGKFTRLASLTGQPAVSVPCGFTEDGLPLGMQLMGRWFDDSALLRVAHAYQRATDWHQRRPPAI